MFLWGFFLREGRLGHLKIVMKDILKRVPIFGWPMQTATFIFLARDFDKDKAYIDKVLKYLGGINYPAQTLLFPEGTDKTATTTTRSNAFGEKQGLKPLKNTLHPRVTGFIFFVNLMKKYGLVDVIYDLTIGYLDTIPQNESAIFTGFPKECHVHLKRYDIKDLPNDEKALGEWLQDRWYEKDERLDKFYKDRKFQPEEGQPQNRSALHSPQSIQNAMLQQAVVWILMFFVMLYFFMNSSVVFWFIVCSWVALQVITVLGGLDLWEISQWEKVQKKDV